MATRKDPMAERRLAPLFGALAQGRLDEAERLLPDAQRRYGGDARVRAIALDLPLMQAARLAETTGVVAEGEGEVLDRAYEAALAALSRPDAAPATRRMAVPLLLRLGGRAEVDRLSPFAQTGREWAEAGRHGMLLQQLPRVRSHADRLELLEQHRIAARALAAGADPSQIRRPPHAARERLRVGFLSADLRAHVVGAFALPLFEHADPAQAELFGYSTFRGPLDPVAQFLRTRATFADIGGLDDRAAAQRIADDDLDVLVELGGTTGANRPAILAYRPARVQVSWMGYPHSLGLEAIDGIVLDPLLQPAMSDLLAEAPLLMPHTWLSLARLRLSQVEAIDPEPPQTRTGAVTFGTANQPYKYSPATYDAWARVLQAVPGSSVLVVRPEAASARFRQNVAAAFAARGVAAERLRFEAVRSGYIGRYNAMDVSLDTFPLTGGTTTAEALWMGVPVVSLAGEALYERLSLSILTNAGLGDLCAWDVEGYVATAIAVARDVDRLRDLRAGLRGRIAASPLGDGPGFARDFFALLRRAAQSTSD